MKNKLNLIAAAIATILSVSSARADWGVNRCEEATQNLSSAEAGLAQATAILAQTGNICGGAIACILTAQNAYNQAVSAVNTARQQKDFACSCQDAIDRLNNAQNGYNQALAILMNLNNICGGSIACIVTGQNAYNQAKSALETAQADKTRRCDGGGAGWRRPGSGGWGRLGGGVG